MLGLLALSPLIGLHRNDRYKHVTYFTGNVVSREQEKHRVEALLESEICIYQEGNKSQIIKIPYASALSKKGEWITMDGL